MLKIDFHAPDLDSAVQQAVRQHIAGALAAVVCPTHGKRLERVHIAGDTPDRLQIQLNGCCDEILALANRALGASDGQSDDEQESGATMDTDTARSLRAFICHASEDKELARRLAHDLTPPALIHSLTNGRSGRVTVSGARSTKESGHALTSSCS